jgi:AcrR family transcriptional regulator
MTSVNRQVERSERSAEALLDAAAELIAEGGLASMTFVATGERAGYSRGLVTARFGSKRGLVDALIRRIWRRLRDRDVLPMAQRDHGLEEVLVLVNAIREQTETEPRDMRAIFALMFEALGPDADLRDRMSEFSSSMRTDLAAALRRGIADGSIRDAIDPDIGAVLITAALTGLAYQWLLEPDTVHLSRSYAALGEFVNDHLAAHRGPASPG